MENTYVLNSEDLNYIDTLEKDIIFQSKTVRKLKTKIKFLRKSKFRHKSMKHILKNIFLPMDLRVLKTYQKQIDFSKRSIEIIRSKGLKAYFDIRDSINTEVK